MSTKTRESCPPKRGASPSSSNGGGRRSPGPSKTPSPDGKSIPSYLRPTASSSNDAKKPFSTIDTAGNNPSVARRRSLDNKPPSPSRAANKSPISLRSSSFSGKTSSDSANKPTLSRRRSFDKAPSPSRTQKSPVASPKPTLRSSSFSGRTGGVQKGVSERNLKGPKDAGKQHTLYARPVSTGKQSNVLAKKQPGIGSSRKERVANTPEKAENSNTHDEPEPQSDDPESSVAGICNEQEVEDSLLEDQQVTDVVEQSEGESHDTAIESPTVLEQNDANIVMAESQINSENQDDKNATVLEQNDANIVMAESQINSENQDDKNATLLEQNDANIVMVESHTNSEDDKNVTVEPCMVPEAKEASGEVNAEEIEEESRVEQIQEQTTTETNEIASDERVVDNPEEEVVKDKEEEAMTLSEKEEVAENGGESHEPEEKEEKTEDQNATPRVAHGKKDLALSNDVIEETKAKLIEKRQNKVKALAGAFESVISLQDPK